MIRLRMSGGTTTGARNDANNLTPRLRQLRLEWTGSEERPEIETVLSRVLPRDLGIASTGCKSERCESRRT